MLCAEELCPSFPLILQGFVTAPGMDQVAGEHLHLGLSQALTCEGLPGVRLN